MKRTGFATVLVALLVVLAGCAGGAGTLTDSPQSSDATETTTSGSSAGDTGTVNFYVSDEENAIGDFEHLNVTIERVTFVRAEGDADGDAEVEAESDDDTTENESANVTATANATLNASNTTVDASANASADAESENETAVEADGEAEAEAESESDERGKVTYEVDDVTVDLTELKGDNATLVGEYDVPEGNYSAVHVEVSNVNGTLENGEQVNIKLPSNKLQINSEFEVANDDAVDFVFDITAFKAGNSGKYILKPVISESGTDVPIRNVDEGADDDADDAEDEPREEVEKESEAKSGDADVDADAEAELNATFEGNVTVGENVTLVVTQNGSAVENASVTVNDEGVGTTDADGTLVVEIPETNDVTVKVTHGDAETEFEFEFEFENVTAEITEDDSQKPEDTGKSDNSDA